MLLSVGLAILRYCDYIRFKKLEPLMGVWSLYSQFQTLFYHQYQARFFCSTHHKTLIKPFCCKFSQID